MKTNYHTKFRDFVLSGDSGRGRHVGIINGKKVKMYKGSGLLGNNIHSKSHEDTPNGFKCLQFLKYHQHNYLVITSLLFLAIICFHPISGSPSGGIHT